MEEVESRTEGAADEAARGPEPGGAATAEATLQERVDALTAEAARLRDENLRVIAEARNQQVRALREKQDALRYAEADFARELLVVLDDLERVQESARTAGDVKAVAEGVRITYEHFLKVLRERRIEPLSALGERFDPTYHEALLKQPSDTYPEGTVAQEVARGWKMHDRVLRAARVVVSAGAAKDGDGGKRE